ncbi:hypothetical protein [Saccharopolyspora elongata]|uniref:Uncharacterized protein n=1 Tax=Saccharopolyspora elongata TaxID=2530387 RepID=A0A4R4Z4C6_9PSEU|nr:hypothetical protein [Saccharopolyspora elongata]TDD52716.1 hypothetical protein E1288_10920 [Saccharopolyspora elongata]
MFKRYRRRWQLAKVKPGDGSTLQEYRIWQLFSRSLFVLELPHHSGSSHVFEVDVRHMADSTTKKSPAALYRDGVQVYRANLPVAFPVPGGVIEVATSQYGLKRMHYVTEDGGEHTLRPHPRSQEGLRARFDHRFPRTSAFIGAAAIAILLTGLAVSLSLAVEGLTRIPVIAQHTGTFTSPIHLPQWAKIALPVAGAIAATERALRLRKTWLVGG